MLKHQTPEEYVQMDDLPWGEFPAALCEGAIYWRLLHVSPESSSWTAVFDCRQGSSFNSHIHVGPGEYFLYKGKMEVRGGSQEGGATAIAPGYGFESSGAFHDKTYFPEDSAFYMTFLGPLNFLDESGKSVALVGWQEVQAAWDEYEKHR